MCNISYSIWQYFLLLLSTKFGTRPSWISWLIACNIKENSQNPAILNNMASSHAIKTFRRNIWQFIHNHSRFIHMFHLSKSLQNNCTVTISRSNPRNIIKTYTTPVGKNEKIRLFSIQNIKNCWTFWQQQ